MLYKRFGGGVKERLKLWNDESEGEGYNGNFQEKEGTDKQSTSIEPFTKTENYYGSVMKKVL